MLSVAIVVVITGSLRFAGARCIEHPNAPRKERPGTWSARKISDGAAAAGKTAGRVRCGATGRFPWLCQTKDDETTSRQDLGRSSHGNAAAEPEAKAKITAHSQRQEMSKGAAAVSRAGSIGGSEQQQPSGGGEAKEATNGARVPCARALAHPTRRGQLAVCCCSAAAAAGRQWASLAMQQHTNMGRRGGQ